VAARTRQSDFILILSALAIAYFIWLIARMSNVEEEVISGVPVTLEVPTYIEAEPARRSVSIDVRFPKSLRRDVHSGAFEVVVGEAEIVEQAGAEEYQTITVVLLPDDVRHEGLPQSVQVEKVEPNRLQIRARYRVLPGTIVPDFVGQPAPGYERENVVVSPGDLLLTGPPAQLEKLNRNASGVAVLRTVPISLENQRDNFSTSVAFNLPAGVHLLDEDAEGGLPRLIRDAPPAFVQVLMREVEKTRAIPDVPVHVATLSRQLEPVTEPTTGTVVISGPQSRVEAFKADALRLEPRNPPEESAGFVGKIAVEARKIDDAYMPEVRIVSSRPDVVLLRYESKPTTPTVTP
jgi:hypothetical protein